MRTLGADSCLCWQALQHMHTAHRLLIFAADNMCALVVCCPSPPPRCQGRVGAQLEEHRGVSAEAGVLTRTCVMCMLGVCLLVLHMYQCVTAVTQLLTNCLSALPPPPSPPPTHTHTLHPARLLTPV